MPRTTTKKDMQVSVRLEPHEARKFRRRAMQYFGMNMAEMLRYLVKNFLRTTNG